MAIECPHKTDEERELKLFYLVYTRHLSRDKEDELRKKYNLTNLAQNRYIKALNTTVRMGQNSRSFCHWCNMKNDHNTIWCNKYCPLCKKEGHWWGKCKEHSDTANKRMDNLSRFVVDIDGETDQSVIHAFLRKTTVRDVDVLRKEVYNSELGFEKVIVYRCKACDKENRTVLAINEHFFSAS